MLSALPDDQDMEEGCRLASHVGVGEEEVEESWTTSWWTPRTTFSSSA